MRGGEMSLDKKHKPCPFCGGEKLVVDFEMSFGHGDSGYNNLRIECTDCSGSIGDGSDYGRPSSEAISKAWDLWDKPRYYEPGSVIDKMSPLYEQYQQTWLRLQEAIAVAKKERTEVRPVNECVDCVYYKSSTCGNCWDNEKWEEKSLGI